MTAAQRLATRDDLPVTCARCHTPATIRRHVAMGAWTWYSLPAGWWLLARTDSTEPHVRCAACLEVP